ncbi:MAG TPA: polysaccharide biosynthesis/export family protein [Trichocoleus sp.]
MMFTPLAYFRFLSVQPLLLAASVLGLLGSEAAWGQPDPPTAVLPQESQLLESQLLDSQPLDSQPLPPPVAPTEPLEESLPPAVNPPFNNRPPLPSDWFNRILGQPQPRVFDDYRLGPGDAIFVTVQRFPDLSFQATLDIRGNVIVPIAGAVNLAGLTLEEVQQQIFLAYDQYVVDPQVSVTLTTQRPVEVTVLGEVTRPGFYPLAAPQVSTALLTAGGSTVNADLRAVRVQRYLADGQLLERTVDLFTPLKSGEALPDVRLQNGDVLVVPRLDPSQLDEYDRTLVASSTLAKPEITVRVLNYASGGRGIEARFNNLVIRNGSRFLDALAQAGINPDLAAYNRIAVLRFNPEKGAADTFLVDAMAAVNGDQAQNIPLQENDVIVVDRNLLARITYAFNTFTQPFRDVLGFLLFFEQLDEAAESIFGP